MTSQYVHSVCLVSIGVALLVPCFEGRRVFTGTRKRSEPPPVWGHITSTQYNRPVPHSKPASSYCDQYQACVATYTTVGRTLQRCNSSSAYLRCLNEARLKCDAASLPERIGMIFVYMQSSCRNVCRENQDKCVATGVNERSPENTAGRNNQKEKGKLTEQDRKDSERERREWREKMAIEKMRKENESNEQRAKQEMEKIQKEKERQEREQESERREKEEKLRREKKMRELREKIEMEKMQKEKLSKEKEQKERERKREELRAKLQMEKMQKEKERQEREQESERREKEEKLRREKKMRELREKIEMEKMLKEKLNKEKEQKERERKREELRAKLQMEKMQKEKESKEEEKKERGERERERKNRREKTVTLKEKTDTIEALEEKESEHLKGNHTTSIENNDPSVDSEKKTALNLQQNNNMAPVTEEMTRATPTDKPGTVLMTSGKHPYGTLTEGVGRSKKAWGGNTTLVNTDGGYKDEGHTGVPDDDTIAGRVTEKAMGKVNQWDILGNNNGASLGGVFRTVGCAATTAILFYTVL